MDSGQRWPIEKRAQPRIASDAITLTFLGVHHPAINWSKIGFLVADSQPNLPIGSKVTGFVSIHGQESRFQFTAELIRRDVHAGQVAFCFEKLSSPLQVALSRAAECAENPQAFCEPSSVDHGDTMP